MTNDTLYIGSDHRGFKLKESIKQWLDHQKIAYEDQGDFVLNPQDDYPDYAEKVARAVVKHKSMGILVCGSAQGVCIAANKIKGVRAVIPVNIKEARLARTDDDANIICLSGWFTSFHQATKLLERFLSTPFSNEARHIRRLNKIRKLEGRR